MNDETAEVLTLVLRIGVAYLVFAVARHFAATNKVSEFRKYLCACVGSALLAWYCWGSYGTHIEDADPAFGGGEAVVDFEPTVAQRNRHGIFVFVFAAATSITGIFVGLKDRAKLEADKSSNN